MTAGPRTWAASAQIGAARRTPQAVAAPAATGPVAAEQASDLAVGLQRTSAAAARVTVLAPSGAALPTALVLVDGHVALPCPGAKGVCFSASVPRGPRPIPVQVRRPGQAPVTAIVRLPPIHAPAGKRLLETASQNYRDLHSVRALNVLESRPGHAVTTNFVVQAPDRVAFSVRGGASARIIGTTRWDREPGRDWVRSPAPRSRVPMRSGPRAPRPSMSRGAIGRRPSSRSSCRQDHVLPPVDRPVDAAGRTPQDDHRGPFHVRARVRPEHGPAHRATGLSRVRRRPSGHRSGSRRGRRPPSRR